MEIQSWSNIVADFQKWWWIYLSMPLVAALIGWFTKLVAIEMMFRPLDFVGVKLGPIPLGWQGMIPRQAAKMAAITYDMLAENLIKPQEIFDRIEPEKLVKEIEGPMLRAVDDVARQLAIEYYPGLWESLPEDARKLLIKRMQAEAPKYAIAAIEDGVRDVERLFDLKDMVITNFVRDRALLNRMIRDVGGPDLKMIPKMGFWFGGIIGVGQAIVWAIFREPLIMPFFGLFNGWITDYLALQMLFRPHEPKRYLGVFKWHGLFAKRRHEVIPQYGELIAKEILTPDKIIEALLKGPAADRVFELAAKHVDRAADTVPGIAKPVVTLTVGTDRWRAMKRAAAEKAFEHAEVAARSAHGYAMEAMDIENTIVERMGQLSPEQYENLLRPAVKEDEPLAIAVGALLGFFVGELQVILVERVVLGHWAWPLSIFLE